MMTTMGPEIHYDLIMNTHKCYQCPEEERNAQCIKDTSYCAFPPVFDGESIETLPKVLDYILKQTLLVKCNALNNSALTTTNFMLEIFRMHDLFDRNQQNQMQTPELTIIDNPVCSLNLIQEDYTYLHSNQTRNAP